MEGIEVVVDRIEHGIVIVEFPDETLQEIPQDQMPEGIKEGYVLRYQNGEWVIDMAAYEKRQAEMEALFQNFF